MARVTVEDCVVKVPNRFKLVLLASRRARDLSAGVTETVERENDKNPVVALREIADETINLDELNEALISGLQKYVEVDEPEDDSMAILAAAEKEWAGVITDSPKDAVGKANAAGKAKAEAVAEAVGEANAATAGETEATGETDAAGQADAETAGEDDGSAETAPDAAEESAGAASD